MATVLGVDGCRGAWVGARVDGAGRVGWAHGRFAELLENAPEPDALVAVDIPIGLPGRGTRRACDLAGRTALGAAAARLFLTPPRAAFLAPDLAAANALLRSAGEPGVSAQAYALRHAVLEVDAHRHDERIVEVHPELSFLAITGRVLAPKRTAQGAAERVAALAAWFDVLAALAQAPPGVPVDDALDALAAAWTAQRVLRGVATRYPSGAGAGAGPAIHA